jgi:RNA polymerase sigma factor (sigma-70 family)
VLLDIKRFHDGDRQLLASLYRAHYVDVDRTVRRFCHGADSDAVIQQVFTMLLEQRGVRESFKGGNMAAWLTTIAANKAKDRLRRRKREVLMGDVHAGDENAIVQQAQRRRDEDIHFVRQALARYRKEHLHRLPKTLQQAFELLFDQGLTVKEIAEQRGVPRTTVSAWQSRLLERIGPFMRKLMAEAT